MVGGGNKQKVPSTAISKAGGESAEGPKRETEGWLRAPSEGVGPYPSPGGNVSLVGDRNSSARERCCWRHVGIKTW